MLSIPWIFKTFKSEYKAGSSKAEFVTKTTKNINLSIFHRLCIFILWRKTQLRKTKYFHRLCWFIQWKKTQNISSFLVARNLKVCFVAKVLHGCQHLKFCMRLLSFGVTDTCCIVFNVKSFYFASSQGLGVPFEDKAYNLASTGTCTIGMYCLDNGATHCNGDKGYLAVTM